MWHTKATFPVVSQVISDTACALVAASTVNTCLVTTAIASQALINVWRREKQAYVTKCDDCRQQNLTLFTFVLLPPFSHSFLNVIYPASFLLLCFIYSIFILSPSLFLVYSESLFILSPSLSLL